MDEGGREAHWKGERDNNSSVGITGGKGKTALVMSSALALVSRSTRRRVKGGSATCLAATYEDA